MPACCTHDGQQRCEQQAILHDQISSSHVAEADACRVAARMMVGTAFSKAIHEDQVTTLQEVRMMVCVLQLVLHSCFVSTRGMPNCRSNQMCPELTVLQKLQTGKIVLWLLILCLTLAMLLT